ncbi:MAG: NAD(P)-dependent oxidoreductase [Microbacterium sp.]
MTRIHVIGLGTMGSPMVARLVASGHEVSIGDADPDAVARASARTGAVAGSDASWRGEVDVLLLMLPNSDVVEAVLGSVDDPGSIAGGIAADAIVLDMSSSRPDSTLALARQLGSRGVALVDAPVSGGPVRASSGELAIMVGGAASQDVRDRVLPVLESLGGSIAHTGETGSAHALKALNNLLSVIGLVGATEVLQVGAAYGLDPGVMLDVINHSTGRNHATEVKIGPQVLDRGWNVGFSLALTEKDITTAMGLAEAGSISAPVAASAIRVVRDALASFDGLPADQTQIAQFLESRNGVSLARSTKGTPSP